MDSFTFVVVSYNQERMIVDTLESIRYQVLTYGKDISVHLIVADDGSVDRTQAVIRLWTEKYKDLFSRIELILREENRGTSFNCADSLARIQTKYYYSISGDDLLSNIDVMKVILSQGEDTLCAAPCYFLIDDAICTDKKKYASMAQISLYNLEKLKRTVYYKCPIQNGGFMSRKLMTKEILDFSKKFDLLDDQARYIKIFEKMDNYKYQYINDAILIYRLSDSQVTRQNGEIRSRIASDKRKLMAYVNKEHKSISNLYHNYCELCNIEKPRIYKTIIRFLDLDNYIFYINKLIYHKKINGFFEKHLSPGITKKLNAHVLKIMSESRMFLEEIYVD